jgi:hypothetical protein
MKCVMLFRIETKYNTNNNNKNKLNVYVYSNFFFGKKRLLMNNFFDNHIKNRNN